VSPALRHQERGLPTAAAAAGWTGAKRLGLRWQVPLVTPLRDARHCAAVS